MIVYSGKNPYGFVEYQPKLDSVRIEISLLNYGIKHGGSVKNITHLLKNINTNDILTGDVEIKFDKNVSFNKKNVPILNYINDHQAEFFDNIYIKYHKKYPYLHPGVPYKYTLMKGVDDFYIVDYNNGNKKWIPYDWRKWIPYDWRKLSNDELTFFYPNNYILMDLYGRDFEKII